MNFLQTLSTVSKGAIDIIGKNKPKILLVSGVVLGVGATAAACRATLKCKKVIDAHNDTLEAIELAGELKPEYAGSKEQKNDIVKAYALTTLNVAKEAALPVVLTGGAIACEVGAYCVLNNKVEKLTETVVGLSAAYTAVDTAFKKYRKNVIDELGEDADERFRLGVRKEKIEVEETGKDGKTKKVKKEISVIENPEASIYAKFFDCESKEFRWMDPLQTRPDWDDNLYFIECQECWANNKLREKGYLFLNEVYESLGLKPTKAGQVVGWKYDPENPNIDNYISFGRTKMWNRRVINGDEYEQCILLDFNVDGVIIDDVKIADK